MSTLPSPNCQSKCSFSLLQESSRSDYNHEEDVQQTEDSCSPGKRLQFVPHGNVRNYWMDT